jgi:hypothetical protein
MNRWFRGVAVLTTLLMMAVGTVVYQKQKADGFEALKSAAVAAVASRADEFSSLDEDADRRAARHGGHDGRAVGK